MKPLEGLIVILAMVVPFVFIKSHDMLTYIYWCLVASVYLAYIALSRW
jgi:hypothetical protein